MAQVRSVLAPKNNELRLILAATSNILPETQQLSAAFSQNPAVVNIRAIISHIGSGTKNCPFLP